MNNLNALEKGKLPQFEELLKAMNNLPSDITASAGCAGSLQTLRELNEIAVGTVGVRFIENCRSAMDTRLAA